MSPFHSVANKADLPHHPTFDLGMCEDASTSIGASFHVASAVSGEVSLSEEKEEEARFFILANRMPLTHVFVTVLYTPCVDLSSS
jgi:hypothetical protein